VEPIDWFRAVAADPPGVNLLFLPVL